MEAFIGSGRIKIAPYASGASFGLRKYFDVGNTSAFQYAFTENRIELIDYRSPAGGVDASRARIDSVTGTLDLRHYTPQNLAMALWGNTNALSASAITDEAHKAHLGSFFPTARLINMSVAPVLKKGIATINTDDYVVSEGGIAFKSVVATSGLLDGDDITVDYTPQAGADIQTLITSAPNVSLFFEGINTVNSKAATVRMYKCKLGVPANVPMIGDDFGTLQVTLTVEKDETVVGAGLSQFFVMQQAS